MFKDVGADVIIYGHDHKRSITRGKKLYVNVGALGCPAKDGNIARGGIIEITGGEASARAIDVVYDVESVVEEIDRLSYPARDTVKRIFYGIN
jgi:predicted phosphodiesterase